MSQHRPSGKMTAGDRLTARLLSWLPWLLFFVSTLPLAAYFLFRSFNAGDAAGEYVLFALTSLGAGAVVGLAAALLVVVFRKRWRERLADRLAADGVTASELEWFRSELSEAERRALKEMEGQNPLLADAYREMLAARLTASRVLRRTQRDEPDVERRLRAASLLQSSGRAELEADLRADLDRIGRIRREATAYQQEIATRLQAIEALASRRANESDTALALSRLGLAAAQAPLTLESAREESDAREEVELELREKLARHQRDLSAIENSLGEKS